MKKQRVPTAVGAQETRGYGEATLCSSVKHNAEQRYAGPLC